MMYQLDHCTVTYLCSSPGTLFQPVAYDHPLALVAVACDTTIPRVVAERVDILLRAEIQKMSVTHVHVQYEAALPHRRNVSQSQRKYIETFVRILHARLEMLDNRLVKTCWRRSLGS